ncbi:MAG: hypothetical protein RLZZ69_3603 [Cyanobacteriota bacterium]
MVLSDAESVKTEVSSTPFTRFSQKSSKFLLPGKRPDTPITATSKLGSQFTGTVSITTLEIYSAVRLPQEPIREQVVQTCQAKGGQNQSEFIVTGSGGLPPSPSDSLRSSAVATDRGNSATSQRQQNSDAAQPRQIVEAQGWMVNDRGNVVLTAKANDANPAANFLPGVFGCSEP